VGEKERDSERERDIERERERGKEREKRDIQIVPSEDVDASLRNLRRQPFLPVLPYAVMVR
jgi:hypothetical protein